MITKNTVKQSKSVVEISITSPWTDLQSKWDANLQKLAADMELSGFRKGQAPLPMVEQSLGNKLQDEFLKFVMPQLLIEALQGSNIVPIDYPKYQLISFTKGQPLSFKATITERPEVKVGDYKNIKVQRPSLKSVTDEEVNKIIDDLYKRWQTKQPAQPAASVSGAMSFNQPTATQTTAIPSDEFAKAVGAASLADLKLKLKTDLENEAKYNNELDYEEAILQQIESITTVEAPEILIEDEMNRMLVSLQKRVSDMGLLMEDYLKGQNETLEGLKTKWRPQSEKNVRMELGLAEVARSEGVQISDSELQAEIDKIQDARLKSQFEAEEPRLHLRHSLRQVKTLDLLKKLIQPVS